MRGWRRLCPPRPIAEPRRILLVQLDHLGDAVLTSPLLVRLRAAYPEATIDVLASASNREVFAGDPHIDRVRVAERTWFDRGRGGSAWLATVWALGRSLRNGHYDLGIDVRGDVLSVLVLALAGIPRRVGWAMGGGKFLLTEIAAWSPGRHEVESRLALLQTLGIAADGPVRVSVHVADADRAEIARRLWHAWSEPEPARVILPHPIGTNLAARFGPAPTTAPKPLLPRPTSAWHVPPWLAAEGSRAEARLLVVHLGAGTAAKRWPIARWRGLIGRFLAEGWRVVVVGGTDEPAPVTPLPSQPNLRDWTGRLTIRQTVALLERADLFVGGDSGPSHLAAAAGTPSVVLFSGTNRVSQWRPWSRRAVALRRRVACRPCHQKVCPLADHPCLAGITPDRVHRAAQRWLARLHREIPNHAAH